MHTLRQDEVELLKVFTLFCVTNYCAWEDSRPTIWLDGQKARQIWSHSAFHSLCDKGILQDIQTGSDEYEIWATSPLTLKNLERYFNISQ